MKRKLFLHFLTSSLIFGVLTSSYFFIPDTFRSLDNRLRDYLFVARGQKQDSKQIAIVTIDEKSLKQLGQWPWERNKIAKIFYNLDAAGALIIGMDVVFAEKDKSSPHFIARLYDMVKNGLPNFDEILAATIADTPIVLGYIFDLKEQRNTDKFPLTDISIKESDFSGINYLPIAKGVTVNLPILQQQAISSGFLNNIPDESGIIRSIPMLMKYQGKIYPSLSFELFRLLNGSSDVDVHYENTGISHLQLDQLTVPTDRFGRLYLNYLGPQKSFEYISATDIYHNQFNAQQVKDRVILIGASAIGLSDLRASPFDNAMPGVENHATALENLLLQDFIHKPDWVEGADIVLMAIIISSLSLLFLYMSAAISFITMLLYLLLVYLFINYLLFEHGLIINILFPFVAILFTTMISTLLNYFMESKQKQYIKNCFSKKLSKNVVEELLQHSDDSILLAQEKEVTIFFSDIRSFTTISEQLGSPAKLIRLLNIYMDPMVEEIMSSEGTVDKFIGDAIMAYWNAPNNIPEHADNALTTSLKQIERLELVNQLINKEFKQNIDIGIGINTGIATVGEMGSTGRSDYTIIGDSVNLASRLESLTKFYGCQIVISQYTKQALKKSYHLRELDLVKVKGKQEPVTIYEAMIESKFKQLNDNELDNYLNALNHYRQAEFTIAFKHFQQLQNNNPGKLYELYIDRCQTYIENPPESFDGVFIQVNK